MPFNKPAPAATKRILLKGRPIFANPNTNAAGKYTYKYIYICPQLDSNKIEFCPDTGAARYIINKSVLKHIEHLIKPWHCYIKGIGLKPVLSKGYTTFTFYIDGLDWHSNLATMEFTGQAWVVPNLEANCLLGTAWLYPRRALIDFGPNRIIFCEEDDFSIPFEVIARAHPCVRRVTLDKPVTLLPGQIMWAKTNYKDLPRDRSFAFFATHVAAVNTLVNIKSPYVVMLSNLILKVIKLSRNTRIGQITESVESGYFASTWKSACAALTVATALTAVQTAELPTSLPTVPTAVAYASPAHLATSVTSPFLGDSPVPLMGIEFTLDPVIRAAAVEDFIPLAPDPLEAALATSSQSAFPVTDAVFQIIQGTYMSSGPMPYPLTATNSDQPRLTDLCTTHSALGIRKPSHIEELVTKEGIYIYTPNCTLAWRLRALITKYPGLWTDRGTIDIPTEMQLKILLVEGWQNYKLNSQAYPLSRRDCKFLN